MSAQQNFTIDQFYQFLIQGKLMAGKCQKCGKLHLPPRPLCDNCYGTQFEWVPVSGKGKLLTYTIIHVAPQNFQDLAPYVIAIVELDDGLRIPGMIQSVSQEQLEIGMTLNLDFSTCSSPQCWPHWPRYCFKP